MAYCFSLSPTSRRVLQVLALSVVVLVVKAHLRLPIPQRGPVGHGLYPLLNEIQFRETAVVSLLTIAAFARLRFRLSWSRAVVAGLGALCLNLAAMMVDARLQSYSAFAEGIISGRYGSHHWIITLAAIALSLGLTLSWSALRVRSFHPHPAATGAAPHPAAPSPVAVIDVPSDGG